MNWADVLKGIQLCIGFQLLLIAFFLFISKQPRNNLLGWYTILICISSLSSAFYDYLEKAPMISVLLGAHLIIFHAPLLFLYIKSLSKNIVGLRNHLFFPICYTLFYLVLKLKFSTFFGANNVKVLIVHLLITTFYTAGYFYYGLKYFRLQLQDVLKQRASRKFRLFYLITNIHAISLYLIMALSYLSYFSFYNYLPYFNENIVPHIFNSMVYAHPVTSVIFMTYLLSETHSLQSLILQKEIIRNYSIGNNKDEILNQIKQIVHVEKKFLNTNFTIKVLSSDLGIGSKELTDFFNEELSISFTDYINQKRVENFKSLLGSDSSGKFSITGLAELSGFKSKATFYRVFKKMEGTTPAKYKEKISLSD